VQPYYTMVENDGNTHSVAFLNSNAQGNFKGLKFSILEYVSLQQN